MRTGNRRIRRQLAAGLVVALLGLLAGCSGGGATTTSSGSPDAAQAGGSGGNLAGAESADKSAPGAATANRAAVQTRAVISTGTVDLTSKDLTATRGEIDRLLGTYGGYVGSEQTNNRPDGSPGRSTLQLRFPGSDFDTVMDALEGLGKLQDSDRKSDDVTTKVIDVNTRVETQQASIKQLKRFLKRATDVNDMINVESEIATRQADLESMLAQQKYLADATSMATITVYLSTPEAHVTPPGVLDDAGFLTGLKGGWHGLLGFLIVAATVLGAVLPFAVAIALVGVPLWLLLRPLVRRRVPAPAPPATPDAG